MIFGFDCCGQKTARLDYGLKIMAQQDTTNQRRLLILGTDSTNSTIREAEDRNSEDGGQETVVSGGKADGPA